MSTEQLQRRLIAEGVLRDVDGVWTRLAERASRIACFGSDYDRLVAIESVCHILYQIDPDAPARLALEMDGGQ